MLRKFLVLHKLIFKITITKILNKKSKQKEKYQFYKSISGEVNIRKMQRILDQLLDEIRNRSRDTRLDVTWLTRESQKRLMNYKELFLHRSDIEQQELVQSYEHLSLMERSVADLGIAVLTYIIDALDKEM